MLVPHICNFLSFSIWFFFIVSISQLRLLISCNEIFMQWKHWAVIVTALKSLSISSNIWFILGLNSIFFYVKNMFYFLDSLDVGKFWIASLWIILICGDSSLGLNCKLCISCGSSGLSSDLFSLGGLLQVCSSSLVRGVGPYTAFSDSFSFGIPPLFSIHGLSFLVLQARKATTFPLCSISAVAIDCN